MTQGIYMITNTINGKKYIGSTNNFQRRRQQHFGQGNTKYQNIHLRRAMDKYGRKYFKFEILEYVQHESELTTIEQYYIDWIEPEYNNSKLAGRVDWNNRIQPQSRKVFCFDNGKLYDSRNECARDLNISSCTVKYACDTQKSVCGLHIWDVKFDITQSEISAMVEDFWENIDDDDEYNDGLEQDYDNAHTLIYNWEIKLYNRELDKEHQCRVNDMGTDLIDIIDNTC